MTAPSFPTKWTAALTFKSSDFFMFIYSFTSQLSLSGHCSWILPVLCLLILFILCRFYPFIPLFSLCFIYEEPRLWPGESPTVWMFFVAQCSSRCYRCASGLGISRMLVAGSWGLVRLESSVWARLREGWYTFTKRHIMSVVLFWCCYLFHEFLGGWKIMRF